MRRILILSFIIFLYLSAWPQNRVTGVVVDIRNNPMPGVKIELIGYEKTFITDIDGAFKIDVPKGVKKMRFTYPRYWMVTKKIKPDLRIKMKEKSREYKGKVGRSIYLRGY